MGITATHGYTLESCSDAVYNLVAKCLESPRYYGVTIEKPAKPENGYANARVIQLSYGGRSLGVLKVVGNGNSATVFWECDVANIVYLIDGAKPGDVTDRISQSIRKANG